MLKMRRLLALLILLAVVALVAAVWQNLSQQDPQELLDALPHQIDLSLDQLHYTQSEEGQRRWTLDADKAEYRREKNLAQLENVSLEFFQAGQLGDVKLSARHGTLQQESRQVEVWDQVVVSTAREEHLYTERLHYDDQARRLTTAEPIRFVSPQMEMTGTGLQVDLDTGRLQVKKNVWVLYLPGDGESK